MDLKQLKYFVRVAELGSFVKASDLLDVAQPTLSRQVRALEIELKTSLFHRNGRGVQLTPLGARFLEQAHGVLHAAEASLQVLQHGERRLTGRVVCGLTPSIGRLLMTEYVRRFKSELPDATLAITTQLSTALHEQLRASRLDFAILHDADLPNSLEATRLRKQSLFAVGLEAIGPDAHQVAIKALSKVPLIMPPEAFGARKTFELAAARAGVILDVRYEVDAVDAVFELVAHGLGHTIATEMATLALRGRKEISVQRVISPNITSELSLVTPAQRTLTPLQLRAAELAKATFDEVTSRTAGYPPDSIDVGDS